LNRYLFPYGIYVSKFGTHIDCRREVLENLVSDREVLITDPARSENLPLGVCRLSVEAEGIRAQNIRWAGGQPVHIIGDLSFAFLGSYDDEIFVPKVIREAYFSPCRSRRIGGAA
jgi:hypothetical protein